jgi:RimJ/RimL family protein N-acetyltransferase
MPELQPTLIGPNVIVRPILPSDWDGMFAAASDPEIWALHPVRDRYTEAVFRAFFDSALASGSAFSIVDRASGRIIGSSRYHDYDPEKREIEIGWTFLARSFWGGRINREVKDLMLTHAFRFVDTVVFWVGETNWRSQRAMEKIGAIRRTDPGIRVLDGRTLPHVVFEIRKAGYTPASA